MPVDTIVSLQDCDGEAIPVSEVHELLTKIYYILDNSMSAWAGNKACIVAYLFNSAFRQHFEVWASQFPFLHN